MVEILLVKERPWLNEAKILRAQRYSYERIAKEIGVSRNTVRRALNPEDADRGVFRSSIRQLSDFEKGLFVGLIEADGSLGIAKHTKPRYRFGFALYPYVDISNTDLSLLEAVNNVLRKYFKPHLRPKAKSHKGNKPMHAVSIHKVLDVLSLLRQLQPHFISEKNKRRCEIVIKYCETRLKKRMSGLQQKGFWQYGDEELKLWEECKSIEGSHKKVE